MICIFGQYLINFGDALTPIQRKRFELLTEASEICKRNKIQQEHVKLFVFWIPLNQCLKPLFNMEEN